MNIKYLQRFGCPVRKTGKVLEAYLQAEKPSGYHILVKGSRVMELERLKPLLVG